MENGTTWKIAGFRFSDPKEMSAVVKAEFGVTGKFLSFILESASGVRRRADLSLTIESQDGKQHREISGKVIRGLNRNHAEHIIGVVNSHLRSTDKVLKIARFETQDGKETIIYKRRDTKPGTAFDIEQTPMVFTMVAHSANTDITAIKTMPPPIPMNRRRGDRTT